ncbi:hypothetical protein GCM10011611_25550 [Aliidongia dinghuensis]|uniref:Uncharacterized protein n=1 Tax=Aliidongia dinghuensis TaxID=1867774 RepID=A0A8J2YTT0_9PROT|nr:hypothetical protein GCM10011611_25550 [Aliidongia dinghuensis]
MGIGSLDEVDVLVLILGIHAEADHMHAEGLQLRELRILIRRAELQRMHEVDAAKHIARLGRARGEKNSQQQAEGD